MIAKILMPLMVSFKEGKTKDKGEKEAEKK
jgi:hypothetical protein